MSSPEQPPPGTAAGSGEPAASNELQRALRAAFAAEPGPAPRARAVVLSRIRTASSSQRRSRLQQFAAWLRAPLVPRWAPAAALLLIMIQAAALVRLLPNRAISSAAVTTRTLAATPTRLRVEFNPRASAAQIRDLLDALGARIVDGPTATGGYVIELAAADPRHTGEKLSAARARRDVLLTLELATP